MPMEFLVLCLFIAATKNLTDSNVVEERLSQLLVLKEDRFIAGFHQQIQRAREKAWHDRHIKQKKFQVGDLKLLYDSKFMQHPHKFGMHWLGLYMIQPVIETSVA